MENIVGKRVLMNDGITGVIFIDFDNQVFSGPYTKENWSYIKRGILIDSEEYGLIQYPDRNDIEEII
jgi:hypothetical protein